jgi:hypothetical protein
VERGKCGCGEGWREEDGCAEYWLKKLDMSDGRESVARYGMSGVRLWTLVMRG